MDLALNNVWEKPHFARRKSATFAERKATFIADDSSTCGWNRPDT